MHDPGQPSVAELLEQLSEGVARLERAESWQAFLAAQARLPRYSYANALLILEQCPDASAVAGFATWRSLGRFVRAGERAIWIIAPLRRGPRSSAEPTSAPSGFRRVAVFDVSQTEGADLVNLCTPLQGEAGAAHFATLVGVASSLGFTVEVTQLAPGLFGDCTYRRRRIRVASAASGAQAVKTLVHELGHAILHEGSEDRALAELEAESVAYVVCQRLGIESADYSFGYVASWAGGTAAARCAIRSSCRRIAEAAKTILDAAASSERAAVTTDELEAPARTVARS